MTVLSEFSRIVDVSKIDAEGADETITASQEECDLLSLRFGVESVSSVMASVNIQPWRRGGFRVRGTATARVTQICVVTLEPFESDVTARLDRIFVDRPKSLTAISGEIEISPDEEEIGEVVNGDIELGEFTVEELLLELDPYPRKDGALLSQTEFGPKDSIRTVASQDDSGKPNPFEVLRKLDLKNNGNS
ncbi:MAG: DUF177 domain-containing protein [Anderseniella sp.]